MYSTAAQVRNVLPTRLIDEEFIGEIVSGTFIELTNPAFDVPTIIQDGTTLSKGTDFSFTRPRKITLSSAADGEEYIAKIYIGISDSDIEDLIKEADRTIASFFARYNLPGTSYLEDWSKTLAASYYLFRYTTATEQDIKLATALEKSVMDRMTEYRESAGYDNEKTYPSRKFVIKVNE